MPEALFLCPVCGSATSREADSCLQCGASLARTSSSPKLLETALESGTPDPSNEPDLGFLTAPERPDELGRLGPYRVLAVLGRGGMGIVFRAEDPQLNRQIALKAILPRAANSAAARARFLREARAQAAVEHDHIAVIHQVGEAGGVPYLAMPLLKGCTLADSLRAGAKPSVAQVVRIAREAAEGLAAAHDTGLVHRDVKPANLWLEGPKRRVKLLDFGLARAADGAEPHLTASGDVVGTPSYMSPEQARGEPLDARTDLFSLGAVLYQMLAGRVPFRAASTTGMLLAIVSEAPRRLRDLAPEVPAELDALTMRLLAKLPADRPGSAREVAEELARIAESLEQPVPSARRESKRGRAVVIVAGAAVLLGGAVWAAFKYLPEKPADSGAPLDQTPSRFVRHAAEAAALRSVLDSGGTLAGKVAGRRVTLSGQDPLPNEPFELEGISFVDQAKGLSASLPGCWIGTSNGWIAPKSP